MAGVLGCGGTKDYIIRCGVGLCDEYVPSGASGAFVAGPLSITISRVWGRRFTPGGPVNIVVELNIRNAADDEAPFDAASLELLLPETSSSFRSVIGDPDTAAVLIPGTIRPLSAHRLRAGEVLVGVVWYQLPDMEFIRTLQLSYASATITLAPAARR